MDLQYPIGKFQWEWGSSITDEQRKLLIDQIAQAPIQLRQAMAGLTGEQVNTPYRPEGWTVRQVVHHLSDSHMNAYVRFRLALTEDEPTIKPYKQERWAILEDARTAPVELFPFLARLLTRAMGAAVEVHAPGGFCPRIPAPRAGSGDARPIPGYECLARPAPHRTHQIPPRPHGVGVSEGARNDS